MTGPASETLPERIGAYRIEGVLGVGGMGKVYFARDPRLDRMVAIKVFRTTASGEPNALARLAREARLLAQLDHPNVVRCFEFGEEAGAFYLVMEWVPGESLRERLEREGKISSREVARIARALAQALAHAHEKGVIHRDVKPGNVLLSPGGAVKLSDFGLARGREDLEITQPGTMVGTPQYVSPEQAKNPRKATVRSDLYSLGATCYHMLTGRTPHPGDTLAEVVSHILFRAPEPPERYAVDVDPLLSRVIARLMARDPAQRYADAAALLSDLDALEEAGSGGGAARAGLSWRDSSREAGGGTRRAGAWRAAAGAAAALLGGAVFFLLQRGGGAPVAPITAVEPAPFRAEDLAAGRLSLAEAHARLQPEPNDAEARALLSAEAVKRAGALAAAAATAARRAVAAGRIEEALAAFEAEAERRAQRDFGAAAAALPDLLASALDSALAVERGRAERLASDARRAVDAKFEESLGGFEARVHDRIDVRDFGGAAALLGPAAFALPEGASADFAAALRTVVPEAGDAPPSPAWHGAAAADWEAVRERLQRRLDRELAGVREQAAAALAAFAVEDDAEPSRAELERALATAVVRATGLAPEAIPGEPGAVAAALAARAGELEREIEERGAARRQKLESDVLDDVEIALSERDRTAALTALERLPAGGAIADPWLAWLAAAVPELDHLDRAALDAFAASVGSKVKVRTRDGIAREAVLKSVDREQRRLVLQSPAQIIALDDVTAADLAARAGAGAPARATALRSYVDGDLEGAARAAQAATGGEILRATVERARRERALDRAAREAEATRLLAEFDRALAAGEVAAELEAAEGLLKDDELRRVPAVKRRLAELRQAAAGARAAVAAAERQRAIASSSSAVVTFAADGTAEFRYAFDGAAELADFRLPGPSWSVAGGRLAAVPPVETEGADVAAFRNRPGAVLPLPFDLERPVHVEFEVEFPYDGPDPGLLGVRVLGVCFVARAFPPAAGLLGQANAWSGDLDEFADHLYEPALGETHPRRRNALPVRAVRLERGNRYRFEVEWRPGAPAECSFKLDGEVVHLFRGGSLDRRAELEIRSLTPIAVDDLRLRGSPAREAPRK